MAKKHKRSLPCRSEREEHLRVLMGRPDPRVAPLPNAIRETTHREYDKHILPLIAQHWPELATHPFGKKLRFLSCDLYASAPYTVLFSAPNRPPLIRAVTTGANLVPMPTIALARIAGGAMRGIGRLAYTHEHRRIIHIAAFIAAIDHAFDHCMDDPPEERGHKVKAMLDGVWQPDIPSLKLTRAIQDGMEYKLKDWEREPYQAALERVKEWIDSEVAAMTGVEDTTGLGHRVAGVEGTIDGLIFPVYRYAGEATRQWMYDVSMYIQAMDDWLDYEDDAAGERMTPVVAGTWDFDTISAMWWKTVRGIEDLVRDSGLRSPHYVRFVRKCYESMLHEVMDAMANGLAD